MEDLQEAYLAIYEESDISARTKRAVEHQRGGTHGDDDAMGKESEASTKSVKKATRHKGAKVTPSMAEEVDSYDLVLDYLLDEGYAETEDNAISIMANMSEEWIDEIIDEAYVDWRKGKLSSGRSPRETARLTSRFAPSVDAVKGRKRGRTDSEGEMRGNIRSGRIDAVSREMDRHTGIGGKINKALSPGLGDRPGASPRVAYGEPNTDRHQSARHRRGQSSTY